MSIGTPVYSTQQFRTAEASTLVNMPATVNAGDFLFIWGRVNGITLDTTPAGWTGVVSMNRHANAPNIFFAYKTAFADGTEGSTTVSVTHASNISTWIAGSVSGVSTTTPIDATPITGDTSVSDNSSSLSGYTTTVAGCLGIFMASQTGTAATSTPPTGWTEVADNTAGTNVGTLCTLAGLSAGSQGTVANTWNGNLQHIEAMFALRPAPTSFSLTETGTGTDALTLAASTAVAETATGTDALTIGAAVPLTETGTGTDALTASAAVPLADTGTGTDALALAAALPLAETGHGTDALALAASTALAETGAFSDALSIHVTVTLTETGSLADALVAGLAAHSPGFMEIDTPSGATIQILDASGARILPIITTGATTVLVTPTFTPPAQGGSSAIPSTATYPASTLYPGS